MSVIGGKADVPQLGQDFRFLTRCGSGIYIAAVEGGCLIGYSITSSARASTAGGTVKPSALAAFKLITNSSLTGA
jgi:hypothetical protein